MSPVFDFAKLAELYAAGGPITVWGVSLSTKKLSCYSASVSKQDPVAMVRVATAAGSMVCPVAHRFLTTSIRYPFDVVPEHCLSWIRVADIAPGMLIAAAPTAPIQASSNQCHAPLAFKLRWEPVRFTKATGLFVNYEIRVEGCDNYIMNNLLNKSYG